MNVSKVAWSNSEDRVKFTMPLTKVDKENRLVSGFASIDNVDQHDDIVSANASAKAFSRFRGNIREMHQPIAVGKMVNFSEDEYFDSDSQKAYKGVYVTVRVSKGAQDTWEKVIDGTLSGFSIGGQIVEAESTIIKNDSGKDRSVRLIKDYEIEELSLVDNPANQIANVFSITKSVDGKVSATGILVEKNSEIVYYCNQDGIAKATPEDSASCPQCQKSMQEVGWIEYTDADDKVTKMSACLSNAKEEKDVEKSVTNPDEAGSESDVAEQGKAQTEVDSSVENQEVDEVDSEPVSEEVEEVEEESNEISKMLDSIKKDLAGDIEKNFSEVSRKVEDVNKAFEDFGSGIETKFETIEEKFSTIAEKHGELSKKFAGLKEEINSVEKSISRIENGTAIKKSGDLGGSPEKVVSKSGSDATFDWGGTFFGTDYLK